MQVSLFIFVLAHAVGKLTTIPLLLKTSLAALPATFVAPWLCTCSTSSLAAIFKFGYPPLGPACR